MALFRAWKVLSMPYPIFDIDLTQPLPPITISDEDTGIAAILRQEGKPIDFLMETLSSDRELKLQQFTKRIAEKAKTNFSKIRQKDDVAISVDPPQFPSLTIAIPTKDRPHQLARCLESLNKRIIHSGFIPSPIEILVVDNASSDHRTREVVSSFSEVRYVCEPLQGVSSARNRALKEAGGQLLAYLDDDVVVDHGWLSGLVEAWSQNPTAAAFTGQVLPYELDTKAQVLFEQRGGFRRGFKKISYGQILPGHSLYPAKPFIFGAGANMAFNRDILRNLGGFDMALGNSVYPSYGEDLDIFYRIIRAGYSLQYEPNYLVFHTHRRELQALRDQYWAWGVGLMEFMGKTYLTDPTSRSKLRRVVVWWFAKQLWQWPKSLVGRHALPPNMILAELLGGIHGLFGGYSRSKTQVEKVQAQLAPSTVKKS